MIALSELRRRGLFVAGGLGLYAAALAMAPDPSVLGLLAAPLLLIPLAWWLVSSPTLWASLFLGAAVLLPPLPFALGNSGPHPSLLLAAVGLCVGLLRLDEWRIPAQGLPAAMLVFLATLFASLPFGLLSAGLAVGVGSLARVLLYGIATYIFLYTLYGPAARTTVDSATATRFLFGAAVAAAAFGCVDFYYQFPAPAGYGPQFVWLDANVFRRAQGLFYEASTLGNFCVFFLVMIAATLLQRERLPGIPGWMLALGGSVLGLALMFSYSRASIVNLLVATATLVWLNRAHISLRRILAASILCVAGGAALAVALLPGFAGLFWSRLSASVQYFLEAPEGVLSGRVETWRVLGGFLVDHPWYAVLGIGYKTLPYSDFIGSATIGDNMYLTLLVETGVVGLGGLLWMLAHILRASLRAARSANARAAFLGAWSFSFWVGQLFQMFSGDLLTYWRVLPVYFFILALAVREADA